MVRKLVYVLGLAATLAMSSCGTISPGVNQLRTESGYCYPPVSTPYKEESMPSADVAQVLDSNLRKKYSEHSLRVAQATGVLEGLRMLQTTMSSESSAITRQQMMARLFLVSTEISSIAAELDCEGERAAQVADFLTQKENRRVKILTILSVTAGALAGIGNATFKVHSTAVASAVIGGSVSAGLGLSALFSTRRVLFNHPRNLLADIWSENQTSAIYPPAIWYMLSQKYFSNSQEAPVASNMKQRWIKFEDLDPHNKQSGRLILLFFGAGGPYQADELRARARMLNQVQAAVKLMNQDLQGLIEEVSK